MKSAPSNNESLTHAVNFGIGSAFSEGPDLGPDPLYKVCQKIVTEFNELQISSFPISFFHEKVNVGNSIFFFLNIHHFFHEFTTLVNFHYYV